MKERSHRFIYPPPSTLIVKAPGGRDWLSILLVTCSPGLLRVAKIRNLVKPQWGIGNHDAATLASGFAALRVAGFAQSFHTRLVHPAGRIREHPPFE